MALSLVFVISSLCLCCFQRFLFCLFPDLFNLVLRAALLSAVYFAHGHLLVLYRLLCSYSQTTTVFVSKIFLLLVDEEALFFFRKRTFSFSVWFICM